MKVSIEPRTIQLVSDLSEVQDFVDTITETCNEEEFTLHIARGDDLPHAVTVKTKVAESIAEDFESTEEEEEDEFDEEFDGIEEREILLIQDRELVAELVFALEMNFSEEEYDLLEGRDDDFPKGIKIHSGRVLELVMSKYADIEEMNEEDLRFRE